MFIGDVDEGPSPWFTLGNNGPGNRVPRHGLYFFNLVNVPVEQYHQLRNQLRSPKQPWLFSIKGDSDGGTFTGTAIVHPRKLKSYLKVRSLVLAGKVVA